MILEFLIDQLRAICKEYQERIQKIESEKYDLEKQVEAKGYEVSNSRISEEEGKIKLNKSLGKKIEESTDNQK